MLGTASLLVRVLTALPEVDIQNHTPDHTAAQGSDTFGKHEFRPHGTRGRVTRAAIPTAPPPPQEALAAKVEGGCRDLPLTLHVLRAAGPGCQAGPVVQLLRIKPAGEILPVLGPNGPSEVSRPQDLMCQVQTPARPGAAG